MSEHVFFDIAPMPKGHTPSTYHVTIGESMAYVSKLSRAAIGNPGHVRLAITADGLVRIKPVSQVTEMTIPMDPSGQMARLSSYCRYHGYRLGRYPVEVRDGALYVQLEKETGGAE